MEIESSSSAVSLYFEDYGAGKPVLLIHDWPLSHRMWEPQVAPLVEAGYRVIAYDRRGFGDSDKPWDGYDYHTFAADLQALLTVLDLNEVTLVGFLMSGGEVARYFGRYGSGRVAKVVLAGAVPPYLLRTDDNPDVIDDFIGEIQRDRLAFMDGFCKKFVNWDAANPPISEEQLLYSHTITAFASPRATERCVTAFGTTDFRQDLPKIDVPTLLVHGGSDSIVPLEVSAQKAAPLIEGSRLEVVTDAPHGFNLTHKDEFNRLLLEFLRS